MQSHFRLRQSVCALLAVAMCALICLTPRSVLAQASTQPAAASSRWNGPFFFIQMSDPQFGNTTENRDFVRETENYEKAVAAANRLKPAFVIITGDLVHRPGDAAQIAEYKRISAKLDPSIPLHPLSGNHDVQNVPTSASLELYRKEIGKDYYSFEYGGCRFIGLNTTLFMRPDIPAEVDKQWNWLTEELKTVAATKPKHAMVFGHHPAYLTRMEEADNGNAWPSFRRKQLVELMTNSGAFYMFAGHLHRNAGGKAGKFEMITTAAVGKPLGSDPPGFRIVKVYEDHLEHEYFAFEKMPESVTLTPATAAKAP